MGIKKQATKKDINNAKEAMLVLTTKQREELIEELRRDQTRREVETNVNEISTLENCIYLKDYLLVNKGQGNGYTDVIAYTDEKTYFFRNVIIY